MTKTPHVILDLFDDPEHAAHYSNGPATFVPGFEAVHRLASILIKERVPKDAHLLIHGAGGGLEIEALATQNPDWTFLGLDPAKPMLDAAKARLAPFCDRVAFCHGFAEDAPLGPYDAATSFLTLHFLDREKRIQAVSEIVRRLKPGAPVITVHCSFPQTENERAIWLKRHREFVISSGTDPDEAERARQSISEGLEVFDPETDEDILQSAGLSNVTLFYAAFTWRGWIGWA